MPSVIKVKDNADNFEIMTDMKVYIQLWMRDSYNCFPSQDNPMDPMDNLLIDAMAKFVGNADNQTTKKWQESRKNINFLNHMIQICKEKFADLAESPFFKTERLLVVKPH